MKNESYDLDEMLTVQDIQKHLKLSKNITYQLIHLSNFPKIKIGNSYRIPKKKYKEWLNQNMRKKIYI